MLARVIAVSKAGVWVVALLCLLATLVLLLHADRALLQASHDEHDLAIAGRATLNDVGGGVRDSADALENMQGDVRSLSDELVSDSDRITTEFRRDMTIFGGAESETEKTMHLIRSETPKFMSQAHDGLDRLNVFLGNANEQVQPAGDLLRSGRKLIDDSDAIVTGLKFVDLLDGMAKTSTATAGMTTDMHDWLHERLYPPKATGKMRFFVNGYRAAKGVIQVGGGVAEPLYYVREALR